MDHNDKIANVLNTKFERNVEQPDNIPSIDQNQTTDIQVSTSASQNVAVIKDQEYIETKLKNIIEQNEKIIGNLVNDMDGGMSLGQKIMAMNAYASVSNAMTNNLRELKELNKLAMSADLVNSQAMNKLEEAKAQEKEKTFKMTASDLVELLKAADEQSKTAVDATYEVIE